uniref:SAM domain-containing protein n=1 Tax=Emiliania huxleyi TaxID=2903 RepID=A0A6V2R435_EMIHU|mmetsp:Transcript_6911/g.22115  ORF Transcript_6911/g.22115 Transcript_6911/m.22115 type:complete len:265 (+) Transcript_6911:78-872(+)
MSAAMSGEQEVRDFLKAQGMEEYTSALIYNGFYMSVDSLREATYEELLDCNVKPLHAKLILSSLQQSAHSAPLSEEEQERQRLASFLSMIGCAGSEEALVAGGLGSLSRLKGRPEEDLVKAGVKPVHARLIMSSLDTVHGDGAAGGGLRSETPRAGGAYSTADGDDGISLLGRKRKSDPKNWRFLLLTGMLLTALALGWLAAFGPPGGGAAAAAPPPAGGLQQLHKGKGGGGKGFGGLKRRGARGGERRNATHAWVEGVTKKPS